MRKSQVKLYLETRSRQLFESCYQQDPENQQKVVFRDVPKPISPMQQDISLYGSWPPEYRGPQCGHTHLGEWMRIIRTIAKEIDRPFLEVLSSRKTIEAFETCMLEDCSILRLFQTLPEQCKSTFPYCRLVLERGAPNVGRTPLGPCERIGVQRLREIASCAIEGCAAAG